MNDGLSAEEALDILVWVYVEYGHAPSIKDLIRLRAKLPGAVTTRPAIVFPPIEEIEAE